MIYPSTAKAKTEGPFESGRLVDDFLRRTLRVGDPHSPTELVEALRRHYASDASRLDEEAAGRSVAIGAAIAAPAVLEGGTPPAGARHLATVREDLEQDLDALLRDPSARAWVPELSGWKETLVREVADASEAARFAADPAQRERAFLGVRRLGDYARIARLVGIWSPEVIVAYRRLGDTLDQAGWAVRVRVGEALLDAGLDEGGMSVAVPAVDARARRDGVLLALRRLVGAQPGDAGFGNGPASLRLLLDRIDAEAAGELRVYLREESMAHSLETLVAAVSRQDPDALRRVAATAPIELVHLQRLLRIASSLRPVPSSALSSFVQSLRLFVEAFRDDQAGARLVGLAVPLPMAVQALGGADDLARRLLRDLVAWRAEYASAIEALAEYRLMGPQLRSLIVTLDATLDLTDRAVDSLAMGTGTRPRWGNEEWLAAVYAFVVQRVNGLPNVSPEIRRLTALPAGPLTAAALRRAPAIVQVATLLQPPDFPAQLRRVATDLRDRERRWWRLVWTLAPRCLTQA